MIRARLCSSLALVLALSALASADDEPKNKNLYSLEASLKNLPEGGSVFELEGTAKNFPDGTLLHVSLNAKAAASPKPVEAAFFMVRVDKERFKARKVYAKQTFAPLQYWAQADLLLSSQRKAIRDWIRRELGLPREARLVLARKAMEIGTRAEQAAFKQKTLVEMKAFVLDFKKECGVLKDFVKKSKTEHADYAKAQDELQKATTASLQKFYAYLGVHVAWHEAQLIASIKNATAVMGRTFRLQRNNRQDKARRGLARADQTFKSLLSGIESRLPKQEGEGGPEKPDKPSNPDESKGSGS